jgi:hypothetical protein
MSSLSLSFNPEKYLEKEGIRATKMIKWAVSAIITLHSIYFVLFLSDLLKRDEAI